MVPQYSVGMNHSRFRIYIMVQRKAGRMSPSHLISRLRASFVAFAGFALLALPARAAFDSGLINVDFFQTGSPTYSGAGVFGAAGDTWNPFGGPTYVGGAGGTNLALLQSDNSAGGATLSYSTPDGFYDASSGSTYAASPYYDLLRDYLVADRGRTDGPA